MSVEGAIFDVDGTLLDSMGIWDTIAEDYFMSDFSDLNSFWKFAFGY